MPLFEYQAYNLQGKTVSGVIDAPSKALAFDKLKSRSLHPYKIAEDQGNERGLKVKTDDLAFSLEQLATLLASGIPLTESLESISFQAENPVLKRAYSKALSALKEGSSFADSLAQTGVFPQLLIQLVKAGENVGETERILEHYADYLKRQSDFTRKFISSITYPMIILVACLGLVFFMLLYIAPTLLEIFSSLKQKLPFSTRALIFVGSSLRYILPLLIGLLAGGIIFFFKSVPRLKQDRFKLNFPMLGKLYQTVLFSRWAHTLALLHGGGVSLNSALAASRKVMDNLYLADLMESVEKGVERGVSLSKALAGIPYAPPLLIQMVESGEKSGELEKLLQSISNFYEKEIDRKTGLYLQFLEPALILFMGLIVAVVVISILLPIFEVNQMIR